MSKHCIIVGASHAAAQLAPAIRAGGWEGKITVIGDENEKPYHHPPLSKEFLTNPDAVDGTAIRPDAFYEKSNIDFILGTRVESIDRSQKTVALSGGDLLSYDKLVLSTGARARVLSLPGSDLEGVHYLRNVSDAKKLKDAVSHAKNAVIIGGGYIGLEMAASLRTLGLSVTLLEGAPRILARVTGEAISSFFTRKHKEEGVNIETNVNISGFEGESRVQHVVLNGGNKVEADLVVVGIGVQPNIELAEQAGLDVENGILVNEYCQTSDPSIYAVGDCANQFNALFDMRLRLESVPNAGEQAKRAAAAINGTLDENLKENTALPWFWSNQYDIKLQIAGISQGAERVVIRGDMNTGNSFAAFYFKGNRLVSADCVNRPKEFTACKKLIAEKTEFDLDKLSDEAIPFGQTILS